MWFDLEEKNKQYKIGKIPKWSRIYNSKTSKTEMTASVQENKLKHTRGYKWTLCNVDVKKRMTADEASQMIEEYLE